MEDHQRSVLQERASLSSAAEQLIEKALSSYSGPIDAACDQDILAVRHPQYSSLLALKNGTCLRIERLPSLIHRDSALSVFGRWTDSIPEEDSFRELFGAFLDIPANSTESPVAADGQATAADAETYAICGSGDVKIGELVLPYLIYDGGLLALPVIEVNSAALDPETTGLEANAETASSFKSDNSDIFMEKMRDPSSVELIKIIRSFIAEFQSDSQSSPEQKSLKTQSFYYKIAQLLNVHEAWRDSPLEFIDRTLDDIENAFSPAGSGDEDADIALRSRIQVLSSLKFDAFVGGEEKGVIPNFLADALVQASGKELVKLNGFKSAGEKLLVLAKSCKLLLDGVQKFKNLKASADILMPLSVYLVVRMNPPNLVSNLRFIQRFRNHNTTTGEAAYYFTNMQAAVSFIENLRPEVVGLDPNAFDRTKKSESDFSITSGIMNKVDSVKDAFSYLYDFTTKRQQSRKASKGSAALVASASLSTSAMNVQSPLSANTSSAPASALTASATTSSPADTSAAPASALASVTTLTASAVTSSSANTSTSFASTDKNTDKNIDRISISEADFPFFGSEATNLKIGDIPALLSEYHKLVREFVELKKG